MKLVERWSRGLDATSAAMFVTDEAGCIRYWNRGAERLLGHQGAEVIGKRCCSVLNGRREGRSWCETNCRVRRSVRRGTLPPQVCLDYRSKDGRRLSVGVTFLIQQAEGGKMIAHLVRDTSRQDQLRETLRGVQRLLEGLRGARRSGTAASSEPRPTPTPGPGGAGERPDLTRRQIQVLRLLTKGMSTESIGEELGVSAFTARNHIQNTIRKMGLHTRIQAVAAAAAHGLV